MESISRRRLLQSGFVAAATISFGPAFWRDALAAVPPAQPGAGPYGPLLAPDANGIQLPAGFTSRVIAQANRPVGNTGYVFPPAPDGSATFRTPDGGSILAVNSEVPAKAGGVSAIRFDKDANVTAAYRILGATSTNCAGGPTPWGTWLSCEEVGDGLVWECDPTGVKAAVSHPGMGAFQHEAACVDPNEQRVYLSEDVDGGGLYRFTPTVYPDLSAGLLEVACGVPSAVTWKQIPIPVPGLGEPATRAQVPEMIKFRRGEGIWFDSGYVYLATTTDETIHAYDTRTATVEILYRVADVQGDVVLKGVDNVVGSRSGDIFVAEDSYDGDPDAMDVCIISKEREVARFLKLTGDGHFKPVQSETVGIAFDPSGRRMYIGSQRYEQFGILYEITGPFRGADPAPVPPAPPAPQAPPLALGLDVAKRISIATLIRRGLAVAFTLDKASTVRVRITARVTQKGRRKTVTLATLTRTPGRGHTTLRVKPGKAMAKLLRARRRALTANVEVRITTPGAKTQTLKRTISLRP